jgi:hypothetical protein
MGKEGERRGESPAWAWMLAKQRQAYASTPFSKDNSVDNHDIHYHDQHCDQSWRMGGADRVAEWQSRSWKHHKCLFCKRL